MREGSAKRLTRCVGAHCPSMIDCVLGFLFWRLDLGDLIAPEALVSNDIAKFSGNRHGAVEFFDHDTETEDTALNIDSDDGLDSSSGIEVASDKGHGGSAFDPFPVPCVERIAIIGDVENNNFRLAPISLVEDLKLLIRGLIEFPQFDREVRITDESARIGRELNKLADDFRRIDAGIEEQRGRCRGSSPTTGPPNARTLQQHFVSRFPNEFRLFVSGSKPNRLENLCVQTLSKIPLGLKFFGVVCSNISILAIVWSGG